MDAPDLPLSPFKSFLVMTFVVLVVLPAFFTIVRILIMGIPVVTGILQPY